MDSDPDPDHLEADADLVTYPDLESALQSVRINITPIQCCGAGAGTFWSEPKPV